LGVRGEHLGYHPRRGDFRDLQFGAHSVIIPFKAEIIFSTVDQGQKDIYSSIDLSPRLNPNMKVGSVIGGKVISAVYLREVTYVSVNN
jgi:hypothetical protein